MNASPQRCLNPTQSLIWIGLCLAASIAPATAADDPIRTALEREIIGPRQSWADVQAFVEARLPEPPRAETAAEWERTAEKLRNDVLEKVIFRGEAAAWRDAETRVEWLDAINDGSGYRIRKLRYEALPGLWIPALLYEPTELRGKVPVVLNVNGHDGQGKAANYKQVRCINLARKGMLALNVEWFGMGQLRTDGFAHGLINAIDLCGSGGVATHYLYMKRGLDVLLAHPNADPERVGVAGLSGGGWQTIFFSSLETRVTMANPVAGYSGFHTRTRYASDLGDSEQTPCDLATVADYTHLTALLAPRPALLTFNAKDNCCFAAGHALPPLLDAAAPIYQLFGRQGNLRAHVNHDPGDHNFLLDNRQALYQILADKWSTLGQVYSPVEIPSDDEVKTAEALQVELPEDNLTLQKLALGLARELPRATERPTEPAALAGWLEQRRRDLGALVRPFVGPVRAKQVDTQEQNGLTVTTWAMKVADAWSVPAVELAKAGADRPVILLADVGRAEAADAVRALVEDGRRVLAIDPFYFGEAKVAERDYLWALMLGTVGERPLGVQAGQVMAVARWLQERTEVPVKIAAVGPRTSTIALMAAALEPEAIEGLNLHEPLGSLKQVIEEGWIFNKSPELFCFGLLAEFDIRQVAELVAPRPILLVNPDDRAREEFEGLTAPVGDQETSGR